MAGASVETAPLESVRRQELAPAGIGKRRHWYTLSEAEHVFRTRVPKKVQPTCDATIPTILDESASLLEAAIRLSTVRFSAFRT